MTLGAPVFNYHRREHPVGVAHAIGIVFILLIAVIGAVLLLSRQAEGAGNPAPQISGPESALNLGVDLGRAAVTGSGGRRLLGDAHHRRP